MNEHMTKEIKHQICGDGFIQYHPEGQHKKPLDAFGELIKEVAKPTVISDELTKYVAALAQGTHEITEVTIRPKRTWVGLTDEEFQMIYDMGRTPAGMMEMVEAKLKEKNI